MTKDEMAKKIAQLEGELEEIKATRAAIPNRVMSALKEISRKGDRMSANLAGAALRDLL